MSEHEPRPDVVGGWLALLRRRAAWAAAVFVSVMAFGVVVLVFSRPVYRAEARLRLGDPPPMNGVSPTAGIFSFLQLGGDPFSNDLELLGSRTLAEALVRDVALSVSVDGGRDVHREALFSSLAVSDSTDRETFEVRWTGPSQVSVRRTAPTDSTLGSASIGVPVRMGGATATFLPRAEDGPEQIEIRTIPFGEALRSASNGLSLVRTRREANVLEITFANADPGVAKGVVSAAVETFLALRAELLERESSETVDSLRTVSRATEAELLEAQAAVERMQRTVGLIAPDAQSEALIERYESTFSALETARAEMVALDLLITRVDASTDRLEAWTTLFAHPRFLDNQTMGGILGRLTELHGQRTDLASRRAPTSVQLRTLDQQIDDLDGALRRIATEFNRSLAEQVEGLAARVAEMDAELARIPERVIELGRLQLEARLLSELLVVTEQRLRQEEIRQALTFANVQVIDPPAVQFRPIWPRTKLGLIVAILLAAGAAVLAVILVERADGRVWIEGDVAEEARPILAAGTVGPAGPTFAADGLFALGQQAKKCGVTLAAIDDFGAVGTMVGTLAESLSSAESAAPVRAGRADSFGAAAAAAAGGSPIVLVVVAGASRRRGVERAARNVREAGGEVAGSVVLTKSKRDLSAFSE